MYVVLDKGMRTAIAQFREKDDARSLVKKIDRLRDLEVVSAEEADKIAQILGRSVEQIQEGL